MARITTEDCIDKLEKYELVALAAQRAIDINSGAQITLDRDNDKDPVIALREIAANKLDIEELKEKLIKRFQTRSIIDKANDENFYEVGDNEMGYIAEDSEIYSAEQIIDDEDEGLFDFSDEIIDDDDITNKQ